MADGPRCKRRKQANPRRNSVTSFNNGLEASSDSDDEDKLHIVEDDSLQEPEAGDGDKLHAAEEDSLQEPEAGDTASPEDTAVLPHNGTWNGVKEEVVSGEEEEEEEEGKDALVEEILQQGDTAVIYPEAPEDEHGTPERGGSDENGTPDTFSQLYTCPYCSRGYKRNASLKEHIKYRHEKSEDNFSCSQCSYTFAYRTQLERHMSQHKTAREQRHVAPASGGNRKFKCTECAKAFKYKHHLKEHLRIHSGEKPYECSNCKKRFSHSGSYSSHISSKKCMGMVPPNGTVPRPPIKPAPPATQTSPLAIAPTRVILKEKTEGKPLKEQLPITQIKSEPVEHECKPTLVTPAVGTNGLVNGMGLTQTVASALPQGVMVVPTVGLMSPISINLSDLQNVLKVAMDGNVLRQVLGTANGVVTQGKQGIVVQQPQQQIISLPAFVDQDGTTKIIINYSLNPTATSVQPASLILKKDVPPPLTILSTTTTTTTTTKTIEPPAPQEVAKIPTDLSIVKTEPETEEPVTAMETMEAAGRPETVQTVSAACAAEVPKAKSTSTCLLCDDCPDGLEALHLLQHRKAANGEAVDSAALDPSFADLLQEAGVTLEEPPVDDLLSLLKTYFASNADPSREELEKISESVGIPTDVVKKWFAKMKSGKLTACPNVTAAKPQAIVATSNQNGEAESRTTPPTTTPQSEETAAKLTESLASSASEADPVPLNPGAGDLVIVKCEQEDPEAPDGQAEPLDLSLPKGTSGDSAAQKTPVPAKPQEQPLNLSCLRKEQQQQQLQPGTIYIATSQSGSPVNIVGGGQLPTLVAITSQGAVGCLSAINTTTKRTILIPQLTYTYTTTAGSTTGAKTVVLNGRKQEKKQDSGSEGVSAMEEQNDSDSTSASQPKKRRLENGVYPCDLCDKVFQKGSSLLRHKYEHTGMRPHECGVCKKAFKHKHHLIEHSRLHSGEKPYQCDKCGKRFSHSGSYSQHMNHRYSYCKKDSGSGPRRVQSGVGEGLQPGGPEGTDSPDPGPWSDSRTTTPPSQLDSDERESEEEDDEDDEDDEAMCMDDIRVVQVDDGECEIYEGNFEDDGEWEEADEEMKGGEEDEAVEEGIRGEEVEKEEEEEKEEGEGRGEGEPVEDEEGVEEEEAEEEGEDMAYEVVEVRLGEGQELEEEEEETEGDKETLVSEDTAGTEAGEGPTDTCIREESDSVGPTEEVASSGK